MAKKVDLIWLFEAAPRVGSVDRSSLRLIVLLVPVLLQILNFVHFASFFTGKSLFLDLGTLSRLVEKFNRVRVNKAKTLFEETEHLGLFTNTYLPLALVQLFQNQVYLK